MSDQSVDRKKDGTGSDVATIRVDVPLSGEIPAGWSAWDVPCGCRLAANIANQSLRTWCEAGDDCRCAICASPSTPLTTENES